MHLSDLSGFVELDVSGRLDARLMRDADAPVVLALSGGGDSAALLAVAARWSAGAGRRLIAVTVDHGLNPDSPAWSRFCAEAAGRLGVEWREARWTGDRPGTGLSAAARQARHALLAEVAHEVGARVILTAHTADDVAEADWMRARGSTLGALREWSPSPAWPEGRGLMLLRPMLAERRAAIRDWLAAQGLAWIDDPANLDARFARSRARQALSTGGAQDAPGEAEPSTGAGVGAGEGAVGLMDFGAGFEAPRTVSDGLAAMLLLSAAGGTRPPRGERLRRLAERLRAGERFSATLAGARVDATGETVRIGREPGEMRRSGMTPLRLSPGVVSVWDGRFALRPPSDGWTVVAAEGRLNRLDARDRRALAAWPAWARGGAPVLIRDDPDAPVLAWRAAETRWLAPGRLRLAATAGGKGHGGETTHESALFDAVHGETPPTDLFSLLNNQPAASDGGPGEWKPR